MNIAKTIIFAATHMNWGMIRAESGEWSNTKYVVYSDGTCWTASKYDEDPHNQSILRALLSERAYRKLGKPKIFRMDREKFGRLKELLDSRFDELEAGMGCDGDGWEMHHYEPGGRCLHSIRGYIYGISELEEIKDLLKH